MEIAKFENNKIINAREAIIINKSAHPHNFACPECDANLLLVKGSGIRLPHFRLARNSIHAPTCLFAEYTNVEVDFNLEELSLSVEETPSSEIQTVCDVASKVTMQIIQLFAKSPHLMKTMNRRDFEELVAELFHGFGYSVELTKQTRDGGKDIIAVSNDSIITQKYIIECKRPDRENPVRLDVVKQLHATKFDEGANKAILVTTSRFTRDAHIYQNKHSIDLQLNDFNDLVEWLYMYLKIKNG
ncbi:restriction endonuclease [Vibrio vulnificus]|nr:restriction endonuclease [Vibrio vulnificus]MCU8540436.1 restriction endonuclease [Vibrio vulnificus]MCU8545041.1 restriction endonuclease [Vibrio vulnificus]